MGEATAVLAMTGETSVGAEERGAGVGVGRWGPLTERVKRPLEPSLLETSLPDFFGGGVLRGCCKEI